MKFNMFAALLLSVALVGCDFKPNSDQVQAQQQEQINAQGNVTVGMPSIVNYQEKRMMKTVLELRDKAIVTITYTQDMNGNLHKFCDSVGYGLPYSTQYTNPQRIDYNTHGAVTLPQADPNGLFSPPSANGTWVLCSNPNKAGETMPVYIEPNVIVSPFPLVSK